VTQVALPIDSLLPEVIRTLKGGSSLVLEAPPGAGKTTRVPRALLEANVVTGDILVLQPRRLPTRLAAQRVAEELGEKVGDRVGYQVRFDDVTSARTRLRFITEGLLTRRLLADPQLKGVGAVVLDEFHERHLPGDLGLAMLRSLQQGARKDLKLCVMSATLEAAPIAEFLQAPRLRSEGKRFDVSFEYAQSVDDRYLDQQVLSAIKRTVSSDHDGDILVFLPGAAEIRRSREACEELAGRHGIELHALHGELSPAEQDRAVRPGPRRKIIFSTNVAETSVTIEGVAVVIDSGVARVASHSPWSGLPTLKLQKISKASATQRAGRAGRTRAGHCVRLYTRGDFEGRPEHDAPEIRRLDLAETVLAIHSLGVRDVSSFGFFEAPPPASLAAAEALLLRLGAVNREGEVTASGRRMLEMPLHPRQARVLLEGERLGVAKDAVVLAAILGERDLRSESRTRFHGTKSHAHATSAPSDLLEILERFRRARAGRFSREALNASGLDSGAATAVDRAASQLSRSVSTRGDGVSGAAAERALMQALLAGYPDRVAKRRRPRQPELLLFEGGSAQLSELSVVQEPEWMIALDVEDRTSARGNTVTVRLASQVEPEWLLESSPEDLVEVDTLEWSPQAERVERLTRLSYGKLVLEESRQPAPPSEEAQRLLEEAALAAGPSLLGEEGQLSGFEVRLAILAQAYPQAGFPSDAAAIARTTIQALCAGKTRFSELRETSLADALRSTLAPEQSRLLATQTPDRITLPGGRTVKVNYEPGKPAWIESRLQDFFGLAQGPALCQGRIPLVLHLLAPNMRAVQVTTDLAGFWERHYPALRKELGRRYPRHSWPEDPRHAAPPAPRPPRR
jgi:ATP-dependent helicase HrpB